MANKAQDKKPKQKGKDPVHKDIKAKRAAKKAKKEGKL